MDTPENKYYETFAFGDSPELADELLALILEGRKTATVSVVLEDEVAPKAGDISLVLDGSGNPACEIETVYVDVVKFRDLTWDMVKLEGEDETFEHWQSENRSYRTRDASRRGYTFSDDTLITYEKFKVIKAVRNR